MPAGNSIGAITPRSAIRTGRSEYAAVNTSPPATISGAGHCNKKARTEREHGGDDGDDDHLDAGAGSGDQRAARVGRQIHPVDALVGEVVHGDGEQQRRDHSR